MSVKTIEPADFVRRVTPALHAKDLPGLFALCKRHWSIDQIVSLVTCPDHDARKCAALALSLVGDRCCLPALVRVLKDPDPMINQMAEHALWSIWFRLGSPEANHQLARGTQAITRRDLEHALRHFSKAIELSPDFAEAYNQRAIVHYLTERFDLSADDCRRAVEFNPDHFGAWAGLGHCLAYLGELEEAVSAYERALHVNPHLGCVRELRDELIRQR
ncbi:MAG TPA: tetratricopeptide repeat protein [Tepidisphaeraceae bacterium]|nr:tetratricopeptide repeat protein [Tepidisphaeraceae bacterium]